MDGTEGIWFPGLGLEDIITEFKWHRFQIISINRKKFGGSGITPFYFPAPHEHGHFSQYRAKG